MAANDWQSMQACVEFHERMAGSAETKRVSVGWREFEAFWWEGEHDGRRACVMVSDEGTTVDFLLVGPTERLVPTELVGGPAHLDQGEGGDLRVIRGACEGGPLPAWTGEGDRNVWLDIPAEAKEPYVRRAAAELRKLGPDVAKSERLRTALRLIA